MKLAYKTVEAFEVRGIRFSCVSKWNGLEEWRDDKGRAMIVARQSIPSLPFARAFAEVFHDSAAGELVVVSASPGLIAELQGREG